MTAIQVGLLGLGTVGSGVALTLEKIENGLKSASVVLFGLRVRW